MINSSGMSLADVLSWLGYTHSAGRTFGKHRILRNGVEVIHATAHEAWRWLRRTGQIGARQ